ncbi:MAG: NTP transferase domain-containing protein [Clostridium perfringens]|nr:NTP transferase domain-containing protein [Clostridium perfringens]
MNENTAGLIICNLKGNELLKIGSITLIKRMVITFQQANVSPIVIVSNNNIDELKINLRCFGVIFLEINDSSKSNMLDLSKIGFNYLVDKCSKVLLTPSIVPIFKKSTIEKLINCNGSITVPSYNQKGGHPILINKKAIYDILSYEGTSMKNAVNNLKYKKEYIEVNDEGIIHSADDIDTIVDILPIYNEQMIHSFVKISVEKERLFFDARSKLLFNLIKETESVRVACNYMSISYSKAWNIIKDVEKALGYAVVQRKQGGNHGGKTVLNEKGLSFLKAYSEFEKSINEFSKTQFQKIFIDNNII